MRRIETTSTLMPTLRAVFDGAKQFGLTDEEAWHSLDRAQRAAGDSTMGDFLDKLVDSLARDILAKERRGT
jgi:hypothetical protein